MIFKDNMTKKKDFVKVVTFMLWSKHEDLLLLSVLDEFLNVYVEVM